MFSPSPNISSNATCSTTTISNTPIPSPTLLRFNGLINNKLSATTTPLIINNKLSATTTPLIINNSLNLNAHKNPIPLIIRLPSIPSHPILQVPLLNGTSSPYPQPIRLSPTSVQNLRAVFGKRVELSNSLRLNGHQQHILAGSSSLNMTKDRCRVDPNFPRVDNDPGRTSQGVVTALVGAARTPRPVSESQLDNDVLCLSSRQLTDPRVNGVDDDIDVTGIIPPAKAMRHHQDGGWSRDMVDESEPAPDHNTGITVPKTIGNGKSKKKKKKKRTKGKFVDAEDEERTKALMDRLKVTRSSASKSATTTNDSRHMSRSDEALAKIKAIGPYIRLTGPPSSGKPLTPDLKGLAVAVNKVKLFLDIPTTSKATTLPPPSLTISRTKTLLTKESRGSSLNPISTPQLRHHIPSFTPTKLSLTTTDSLDCGSILLNLRIPTSARTTISATPAVPRASLKVTTPRLPRSPSGSYTQSALNKNAARTPPPWTLTPRTILTSTVPIGPARHNLATTAAAHFEACRSEWACAFCRKSGFGGEGGNDLALGEIFGPLMLVLVPQVIDSVVTPSPPKPGTRSSGKKVKLEVSTSPTPPIGMDGRSPYSPTNSTFEVYLHRPCITWATLVDFGPRGFLKLDQAVMTANQTACSVCHSSGANIRCSASGCQTWVHYSCGLHNDFFFEESTYTVYCPKHKEQRIQQMKYL